MNADQYENFLKLKGLATTLPSDEQMKCREAVAAITALKTTYGETAWTLAVALIGAELASKD